MCVCSSSSSSSSCSLVYVCQLDYVFMVCESLSDAVSITKDRFSECKEIRNAFLFPVKKKKNIEAEVDILR